MDWNVPYDVIVKRDAFDDDDGSSCNLNSTTRTVLRYDTPQLHSGGWMQTRQNNDHVSNITAALRSLLLYIE